MKNKIFIKNLFVICAFILSTPAFALRWGVFANYKQNVDNYAMYKFINNKPILYHLSTSQKYSTNKGNPAEDLRNQLDAENKYTQLMQTAFDTWRKDTKKFIQQSGKTQEFKDIMPYLDRPVRIAQIANAKEADLIIQFTSEEEKIEYCGSSISEGCFSKSEHKLVMVDPFVYPSFYIEREDPDRPLAILIHEFGHFFGLSDQYVNLKEEDPEASTTNRFLYESSVMAASFGTKLYCDDVDAFINLIDLTLAIQNNGKFSARAQKGWASFCNDTKVPGRDIPYQKTFYKEARIVNKKDSADRLCKYSYDAKGNVKQRTCPTPYNFYNKELEYNKYNLIRKATEADGEYLFNYENAKGPKIIIGYVSSFAAHSFESVQKEIDGKKVWTISPGYNIYAFDAQGYVEVNDRQCKIHNFVPNTDFKAYDLTITDNRLKQDYSYTFVTNSLKPAPIYVKKQNNSCAFEICDEKMLKKLRRQECVNLFENDDIAQIVADYAAMDYEDLLDQTDRICRENLSSYIINNAQALCNYFKEVDTFFNKLEAQGEKVGVTYLLKKGLKQRKQE